MEITLRNKDIWTLYSAFDSFVTANKVQPMKLRFALSKNIQKIEPNIKHMNDIKTELNEKYGKVDKKSGKLVLSEANQAKASEEWNELMDIETEVSIHQITEDALLELDNVNESNMMDFMFKYLVSTEDTVKEIAPKIEEKTLEPV